MSSGAVDDPLLALIVWESLGVVGNVGGVAIRAHARVGEGVLEISR